MIADALDREVCREVCVDRERFDFLIGIGRIELVGVSKPVVSVGDGNDDIVIELVKAVIGSTGMEKVELRLCLRASLILSFNGGV